MYFCVQQVSYSSDQLDMLALCFTAVKALYVGGAMARAARCALLLAPVVHLCRAPVLCDLSRIYISARGAMALAARCATPLGVPCFLLLLCMCAFGFD
jgi:hypothetical protein